MPRTNAKTHALIDGDIPLYQACSAVEHSIHWGDDWWTLHADAKEAREMFDLWISDIKETLKASKVTICFSSSNNWRMGVLPEYKANRAKTRKPVCYAAVKEYCIATYSCLMYPTLEADDVIGLTATNPRNKNVVIVSEDKDLLTIPGRIYNPRSETYTNVSPEMAHRTHLMQTLTGDTTDNYKGCPGIGAVKAEKILNESCSWEAVVAAYTAAGLTEADALTQARVARILQHKEFYPLTGEVRLWTPTSTSSTSEK